MTAADVRKQSSLPTEDVRRPAHQDIVLCHEGAEAQAGGHLPEEHICQPRHLQRRRSALRTLTACLAWMLADPSARMALKTGFRVLSTSSLSMPEPSWMHKRQAREAAARCSSPLPGRNSSGVSIRPAAQQEKDRGHEALLEPFFRQRSMLSVMVILLSKMNSYRMRVAMAVFSPSSAPCLVFALRKQTSLSLTPCWVCHPGSRTCV